MRRALAKAKKLYRDFTGMEPDSIEEVTVPDVDAAVCVGTMDFLGYTTVRDGVTESYIHEFDAHARPLLCVTHDGQAMVILGGGFTFGEAGFVDDPPA
jgi:hypothetical protein